jgi:putative sterol carrier protein
VRVDSSGAKAVQGEEAKPSITLSSSWRDWLDLTFRRVDPRAAVLRRRVRPRGSPLALWRLQRVFPR